MAKTRTSLMTNCYSTKKMSWKRANSNLTRTKTQKTNSMTNSMSYSAMMTMSLNLKMSWTKKDSNSNCSTDCCWKTKTGLS